MTQEQKEYDEEQYRKFDSSLLDLIGKEYIYKNNGGDSITVKIIDSESGFITFRYSGNIVNTDFCIVDTKYDFCYYNILNVSINELLLDFLDDKSILTAFLLDFKNLEININ